MRILAVDYGTKAIGLAVCDELQLTTRPLLTLRRDKLTQAQIIERLDALVRELEIGTIVLGLPLNMDGTRGAAVEKVERFMTALRATVATVPLTTLDERLTSVEADQRLRELGVSARERRAKSDEYAALIILQDYLAAQPLRQTAGAYCETSAAPDDMRSDEIHSSTD